MSRATRILVELEAARFVSADDLAAALGVGRRTLSTEVAALQYLLGTAASITLADGRYRLLVADPARYRAVRASVSDDASINDPGTRASMIVARLFRALVPVRIDDLAASLSLGRTTVVADLARVRDMVAEGDLTIEGRPNVGLTLTGPELQQRLHVLRWHFPVAYPSDASTARVEEVVHALAAEVGLDRLHVPELARWAIVTVDRARMGHHIDYLPNRYHGVAASPAHDLATTLAARLRDALRVELYSDDVVFLALPVAGMRAPDDGDTAKRFNTGDTDALVVEVLEAVRAEMEINLRGSGFLSEFGRHLAYMVNRMRYRIWVDDSGVSNIRHEFPVAYQMATVAARVIADQVGLPVEDPEVGFLAAYFQVFLESRGELTSTFLRVAVVASMGRVTAELARLQLAKLLPPSTLFTIISLSEATPEGLADADLVVVTGNTEVTCAPPVLHVTRVLDSAALERQLERIQLHVPLNRGAGRGTSVLASAIDEAHFFALPRDTDYADAVDYMTGHLEARRHVEAGFGERIRAREAQSRMQLDPWLGFPHATLETQDSVMVAVGVVPREPDEDGLRLVVLLGVPADPGRSEGVLVQVYDEVLRLGARRDLLSQLSLVTSFEQFYYVLETNPLTERER